MSTKSKIIIALLAICLVGIGVYTYVMHGGARDLTTEETQFAVSSKEIIGEFAKNPDAATKKYINKAVAIKGTITGVEGAQVMIDNSVSCTFKQADASLKVGEMITVKGRIVGFDDLMSELKLDECFNDKK